MIIKNKSRHAASLLGLLLFLILAVGSIDDGTPTSNTSTKQKPKRETEATPDTEKISSRPKINAELSNLVIEIDSDFGIKTQFFDLTIRNLSSKDITLYVVVYAKNDRFSPPRRGAWPMGGVLFYEAGTGRGNLSYHDIMRNWNSKPDNSKGCKVTIPVDKNEKLEGALPINKISQHEAWRGKPIDPRANYEKWNIWVFSERGELLFKKTYEVK
ncbi:MAG: hypothetical protein JXB29_06340 [Sedimentisphaerales bacterium]|nr:hypothetical protein [Sedimentisphaerales bacterium]